MYHRPDPSTILVDNPLCGNASFAKASRLPEIPGTKWWTPGQIRDSEFNTAWRNAQRIVLVRDPVERFQSGATLALNCPAILEDAPERFRKLVEFILGQYGMTVDQHAQEILSYIRDGGPVPAFLSPQSLWLTARFDAVIATHDVASYFNQEGKVCCLRSNQIHTSPSSVGLWPIKATVQSDTSRKLLHEAYRGDYQRLEKLVLWSTTPGVIRFLSGNCATCKQGDPNAPDLEDLRSREDGEKDKPSPGPADSEVCGACMVFPGAGSADAKSVAETGFCVGCQPVPEIERTFKTPAKTAKAKTTRRTKRGGQANP